MMHYVVLLINYLIFHRWPSLSLKENFNDLLWDVRRQFMSSCVINAKHNDEICSAFAFLLPSVDILQASKINFRRSLVYFMVCTCFYVFYLWNYFLSLSLYFYNVFFSDCTSTKLTLHCITSQAMSTWNTPCVVFVLCLLPWDTQVKIIMCLYL